MLRERLQILISIDQRRLLETEAAHRGVSVGNLVREAIEARFGGVSADARTLAVSRIAGMHGKFLDAGDLERLIDEERDEAVSPRP